MSNANGASNFESTPKSPSISRATTKKSKLDSDECGGPSKKYIKIESSDSVPTECATEHG